MFQKDDYIVVLELNDISTSCAKEEWIFKQRETQSSLCPCVDLKGSTDNSNGTLKFDKSYTLRNWRYATQEEIALYELNGKPCSISELVKNTKPVAEDFYYLIEIFTKLNIK